MTGLVLAMLLAGAGPNAAASGECASLAPIRWLLAKWVSRSENRITTETWRAVSADTFEGLVVAQSHDTGEIVPLETLRLVAMSGNVFYIAKVSEHSLPISFTMTACDEQTAVFENPEHDFPRVIDYRLADDDVLTVRVTDGGVEGFTLRYTRADSPAPDRDRRRGR